MSVYFSAAPVKASFPINTSQQFSDSIFTTQAQWGQTTLYGAWINVSGVQVLYLAYLSWHIVDWFVGFHYRGVDGSNVFVGNTFTAFELFNDTDHDGIVKAPANRSQPTEVVGWLGNFSIAKYTPQRIREVTVNGLPHYQWGISYTGYAIEWGQSIPTVFVNFNNLTFNYDYYVNGSTANLKESFQFLPKNTYAPFNGLGLAAGYSATTLIVSQSSSSSCQTFVDRQQGIYSVCAGIRPSFGGSMQDLKVQVGSSNVFEYLFGGNYTLNLSGTNSTYKATASLIPPDGAPPAAGSPEGIISLGNMEAFAREYASLVIPNASELNLTYAYASILYRVSYPTWSGGSIFHDPELIAYLGMSQPVATLVLPQPLLESVLIVSFALILMRRPRLIPRIKTLRRNLLQLSG